MLRPNFNLPINISIAAPAYNEGSCIREIIEAWRTYLIDQPQIKEFEIVICNDGSTDDTQVILNELSQSYPELKPIHLKQNQGAAAALTKAIRNTQYEWVLLIDSDGQFPIRNISSLIKAVEQSTKPLAFGQGIRQKKDKLYLQLGTKLSGFICNVAHGTKLRDFNSAFKLVPGNLLRSLTLEAKGMNYSSEITSRLLEAGAQPIEVSIDHQTREHGRSHIKLIKDSLHRCLFVSYIVLRQILLKFGIINRQFSNDDIATQENPTAHSN